MARLPRAHKLEPPYDALLEGTLSFKQFEDAEATIRKLDGFRRQFLASRDDKGIEACRSVGLLGRRRAESISRSRRVSPQVRRHKAEIARWFQLWLENPEIFQAWLEMRKGTEEYQEIRNAVQSNQGKESPRETPDPS